MATPFTQADYPELPQKDGFYAEWSTPVVDNIHLDTTVRAVYTSYTPALTSSETRDNGRTIFLVEGLFGGSNALKVTAQEPSGDLGGVTEQWLLEFSDDGQAEHTIRYLTPAREVSMSGRPMAAGRRQRPAALAATPPSRWKALRLRWPLCRNICPSGPSASAALRRCWCWLSC